MHEAAPAPGPTPGTTSAPQPALSAARHPLPGGYHGRRQGEHSSESNSQPSTFNSQPLAIPDHELLRRIGGGSYGEVWLARNVVGTLRAVKVVQRQTFERDEHFEREFTGIQKFEPISRSHEGLVDILQIGRNDADGYFYYVMELADDADGEREKRGKGAEEHRPLSPFPPFSPARYTPRTLRALIRPGPQPSTLNFQPNAGRLPVADCVRIGLALTAALEHLHKQGLLHRDIKPANIIFVDGLPKLADIGLVAEAGEAKSLVGTVGYIPPEGPGSAQADLYSLGKVLYELVTGKDRQDFPALPPEFREQLGTSQLTEFNEILLKACESDPRHRYASAQAMHDDLALLQHGQSVIRKHTRAHRLKLASQIALATAAIVVLVASGWLLSTRFNASTLSPRRSETEAGQRSSAPLEANSIAVLPFVNESKLSHDRYLSDALADETIQAFTNITGLRVTPRSAVFAFKGQNGDPRHVGQQLGVRTVLAGSMKKSSNQLHVAAHLIHVADGSAVWSARYDREARDIGGIQSEVVLQVARQLKLSLDEWALRRLETNLARKLAAYQLYSQARSIPYTSENAFNKSIELLNRALVEDPDFGEAYAELAHIYEEMSGWMLLEKHAMSAAKQNALRALQLDDSLAVAHLALGNVLFYHELDFMKAETEVRRALERDPHNAGLHGFYAKLLSELGRFEEAEQVLKQGELIDPKAQAILGSWCWRYYLGRRFEDALRAATHYLSLLPNDSRGFMYLGWAQDRLGHHSEALVTAQTMVQLSPVPDFIAFLGRVHGRMGHRDEAQKALDDVRVMFQSRGGSGPCSAEILLALGDTAGAIEQLQQAVAEYPPTVLRLKTDPLWDELRSDLRFVALVRKMNLEK